MEAEKERAREAEVIVTLRGNLTIRRAVELKAQLAEALGKAQTVLIEFADYREADLSFIQLLCSAHRTALRNGGDLRLGGGGRRAVLDMAHRAGFFREKACSFSEDRGCLWMRGAEDQQEHGCSCKEECR